MNISGRRGLQVTSDNEYRKQKVKRTREGTGGDSFKNVIPERNASYTCI